MIIYIALAVAFGIPLVYLYYGVIRRDFFQTGNKVLMILCFAWGWIAYEMAVVINSTLLSKDLVSYDNLVRYVAPVLEELLKGAILVYLIRRNDFTYFVDGAIYGFTTGIGFAVFENIEYVFGHSEVALGLALARVFSTNLIHATACGSIGIAMGLSRFERSGSTRRLTTVLASVLVAMGLHMAFNNLVNRGAPVFLAILVGCAGGILVVAIMLRGMQDLKGWVNEELKEEQRVTSNEASIVNQFEKVDKILAPFSARFGPEKAGLARQLFLLQAQMGIHRRTAEKLQDEALRQAAELQVKETRHKMEEIRKELGWYCMLNLRGLFPGEGDPWWGKAQASLAPKEMAGKGLWTSLNKKTKEADAGSAAEVE